MAALCDIAYVLIRDDIVRRVEADRMASFLILAVGGQCDIPDVEAELDAFERSLSELPKQESRTDAARRADRDAIRSAIGLPALGR